MPSGVRASARAEAAGVLAAPIVAHGPPIGHTAFLRDPDGNQLELSFGQEIERFFHAHFEGRRGAGG